MKFKSLAAALAFAALPALATPIVVNVAGAQSIHLLGEPGNTVWLIDIGAHAVLNSLDWNVTLNALAPSLLSEMQVSFGNASGLDMLTFAPASGDFASGVGSYTGSLDLSGLGVAAGADGKLRIEFSESFKDLGMNIAEGQWTGGTLTFDVSAVPEPAGALLALTGLGLVVGGVRRRQAAQR